MRHPHHDHAIHHDGAPGTQLAARAEQGTDAPAPVFLLERIAAGIEHLASSWTSIARDVGRIADKLDPPPPNVIDSPTVAARLACTSTWVAEMARRGEIPAKCVVPGTGNGKPWKFFRDKIDEWLRTR